jgi:tripartite-type tricarboxylate transporter receptor subunit TctC
MIWAGSSARSYRNSLNRADLSRGNVVRAKGIGEKNLKALLWAISVAVALTGDLRANAQTYPSRAITIIVPFAAGGPTDTLARIVGGRMQELLGQPIVIENVTGAGSTIGTDRAIRAAPDGYTLIVGNWSSHVGAPATYPVNWDIINDLEPVARLSTSTLMIVGKKALPANNIQELIAWLKLNPDKGSAATVGAGSATHLCGLYFQERTGTRFQFVPYRGGASMIQDLIAGQIDFFCGEASQSIEQVRAGNMKAFAVMSKERWPPLPDVPTMEEAGLDMQLDFWHGMWAPKHTSSAIVSRLNTAVVATLSDPGVRKRIADLGHTIPALAELSPQALSAYHKTEVEKWWPIIRAANIKVE